MDWLKILIDYGIIGLLLFLSIVSVAIAIERFLVLRNIKIAQFPEKKQLEVELTKKLHIIAIIGANAPYIGLLGTVLGIMLTFYSLGKKGFMDTSGIMVGLALALKATAIGLLVAIPSIVFYNLLLRKIEVLLAQWETNNGKKEI
ncbi:MAG: TonB-system energizer ExbB [bacterium]